MNTQMMNQQIAEYFKTQPIVRAWIFGSFARGLPMKKNAIKDYHEKIRKTTL